MLPIFFGFFPVKIRGDSRTSLGLYFLFLTQAHVFLIPPNMKTTFMLEKIVKDRIMPISIILPNSNFYRTAILAQAISAHWYVTASNHRPLEALTEVEEPAANGITPLAGTHRPQNQTNLPPGSRAPLEEVSPQKNSPTGPSLKFLPVTAISLIFFQGHHLVKRFFFQNVPRANSVNFVIQGDIETTSKIARTGLRARKYS